MVKPEPKSPQYGKQGNVWLETRTTDKREYLQG
jgi:hypothetical protein